MALGMVHSYKGYIDSKKVYLKRKNQLNREIKHLKRAQRRRKGLLKISLGYIVQRKKDDIEILRIMYKYEKYIAKRRLKE